MCSSRLWLDPDTVSISVVDGEVALAGEIENRTRAQLVEAYVRWVPGVVAVRSELRGLACRLRTFDRHRERVLSRLWDVQREHSLSIGRGEVGDVRVRGKREPAFEGGRLALV